MTYWRIRPIQTTGSEIPTSTKTIEDSVQQRPGSQGREDPDRKSEEHPEDGAAEHERGGDGGGLGPSC